MADSPYRVAQLLKSTRRYWMQALMAVPKTCPWRITGSKPMADPEMAYGGLP